MLFSLSDNISYHTDNYINEAELQTYIEKFPDLLNPVIKINKQEAPLLILSKEFSVKSGYLDFLAIDIEGNLYIIETKLAENSEIRRAIIGQVLEYASNLSEMSWDNFSFECNSYIKSFNSLENYIFNFFRPYNENSEFEYSSNDYKSLITEKLSKGRFNIIIISNNVNFEIQKLFNYIDEITTDKINFIVFEINKFLIDKKVFLYLTLTFFCKQSVKPLFFVLQTQLG